MSKKAIIVVEYDTNESSDEFVIDSIHIDSLDTHSDTEQQVNITNESFELFQVHKEWNARFLVLSISQIHSHN